MYSYFPHTDWVTPFGLIFIIAILVAWYFARRNAKTIDIDPSHIDLIVPVTIVVGIAGAILLARIMPIDPTGAGGAMSHGPRVRVINLLATGVIGVLVYTRIARLSFPRLLDLFALPVVAGLAVHRVGCFLAGCCWGDIAVAAEVETLAAQVQTTSFLQGVPGAVQYPPGSLPFEQHVALGLIGEGALASLPVYPVQLYEAALLLVMILVLSRVPWRRVPAGTLVVLTVSSYALLRFTLEFLRADGQLVAGSLTVVQLQCMFLALTILLLPRLRTRPASHTA
jgi:phosphatidylglycerol:prolipoprotein diacylglycerol transferase